MVSIFYFFFLKDKVLAFLIFAGIYRIPDHWTKVMNETFTKSNRTDIENTKFLRSIWPYVCIYLVISFTTMKHPSQRTLLKLGLDKCPFLLKGHKFGHS